MSDNNLNNRINNLDSIVKSIINKFINRAEFGFNKYKTNMDRNDLTIIEWIDHSIEEKMDDIIYMQKIRQELIKNNLKKCKLNDNNTSNSDTFNNIKDDIIASIDNTDNTDNISKNNSFKDILSPFTSL